MLYVYMRKNIYAHSTSTVLPNLPYRLGREINTSLIVDCWLVGVRHSPDRQTPAADVRAGQEQTPMSYSSRGLSLDRSVTMALL